MFAFFFYILDLFATQTQVDSAKKDIARLTESIKESKQLVSPFGSRMLQLAVDAGDITHYERATRLHTLKCCIESEEKELTQALAVLKKPLITTASVRDMSVIVAMIAVIVTSLGS